MTSEEIKALGLREGDVMRYTAEAPISDIDDSDEEHGPMITMANNRGSFWPEDFTAIERVMPPLPDGWTWNPEDRREVEHKEGDVLAFSNRDGSITCWRESVDDSGTRIPWPIPALVAKALLEVWGRGR